MPKKLISIVLPAYQEEQNISYIYNELLRVIHSLSAYGFEIIFVNDGSTDGTWQEIEKLCEHDGKVKWVNLSRNFGKEIAITAWLEYSIGNAVITLDSDGQHPVEKIPEFIEKWQEWFEVIYNKRPVLLGASIFKKWSSRFFYTIFNLISDFKFEPWTTDYRLLDRLVVDIYLRFKEKNRMYRWLIDWLGFKKIELIFDAKKRSSGKASYSNPKLINLAINNIASFSLFPLKFIGYFGVFITSSGGFILILQVLDKLNIIHIGFSNLGIVVVVNTIMMGIVLISLWFIGIYVASIHEEVIWRPLYVVKRKINFNK